MAKRRVPGNNAGKQPLDSVIAPEQLLSVYFNSAPVGLAIIDKQLRYRVVNSVLAEMTGKPPEAFVGKTLGDILGKAAPEIEKRMRSVFRTGRAILNSEITAQLPTRSGPGWWMENLFPLKDKNGKTCQVGALIIEITKQKNLEQQLRAVSTRLFKTQDQEQRQVSRDLHEVIGQNLAGLILTLSALKNRPELRDDFSNRVICQALQLARNTAQQVLSISNLLYPPMLDDFGLVDGLRWYARQIADQRGLDLKLFIQPQFPRLPQEIETVSFRVIQQALRSALQLTRGNRVHLHVRCSDGCLNVNVRYFGRRAGRAETAGGERGVPGEGFASMRERLRQVGGTLSVEVDKQGTQAEIRIPLHQAFPEQASFRQHGSFSSRGSAKAAPFRISRKRRVQNGSRRSRAPKRADSKSYSAAVAGRHGPA